MVVCSVIESSGAMLTETGKKLL